MTEYDFSPEAIERHQAKLRGIDRWRNEIKQHELANPFQPIPGEHSNAFGDAPSMPRSVPLPQPLYADPQKREKKHRTRSHSQRPPMLQNFGSTSVLTLPSGGYATRSFSSPPSAGAQQQFTYPAQTQPYTTGPYGNPLGSAPQLVYPSQPRGRPPYSSQSSSYTHPSPPAGPPLHVSGYPAQAATQSQVSLQAAPAQHYIYQQHPPVYNAAYPTVAYQLPGGGYVIVPAVPAQYVQTPPPPRPPQPKSSGSQSFFGTLGFGKKKRSRRDSY